MAAHTNTPTQPALALAGLHACTDVPAVFALFRKLRYLRRGVVGTARRSMTCAAWTR